VSEQVVHFFEAIEVDAQHGEPPLRRERDLDLLIELLVEARPVGEPGESVVMGEVADMLFRLLARPQIAHRDGVMRLAAEIDRSANKFDRHLGAVGMMQFAFDRLVRAVRELEQGPFLAHEILQPGPGQTRRRLADK
jgi:hypothetical protein